jgi:transcriptional regulator with XRE-family HTH domain
MEHTYSFGDWVRQRRTALDLTRVELSQRAGCSVSALRKIEADERRPSKQLAALLANGLGITPDERPAFIKAARGQLRVDRLGPPAFYPIPEHKPSAPLVNLPVPPTPLIGRESELATMGQLLGDLQCRLLTVVGPGGIGKTRLAIEAASRHQDRFPDGACFVSLAALNSSAFLVPAIADSLGFVFQGQVDPRLQLLNYLRAKEALLVLDNAEHLLDGVGLFGELLTRAPGLKLLVTSRERLNLQGVLYSCRARGGRRRALSYRSRNNQQWCASARWWRVCRWA